MNFVVCSYEKFQSGERDEIQGTKPKWRHINLYRSRLALSTLVSGNAYKTKLCHFGRPCYEISVSSTVTGMKVFPYGTLRPGYRDETFFDKLALLSKLGGQNGIILPCMHFHFKSIRISFISKVTRVDKAMIVENDTRLCGVTLVLFFEFHPGHRAEISRMNRRQNPARLPSQPGYRAHMKRP